jgi:Tol biopolymer transport system component
LDGGSAVRTGAVGIFQEHRLYGYFAPSVWTADGSGIIFSAHSGDAENLWQVDIAPKTWHVTGALRQLTFGAGPEVQPSLAAGRLAFSVLSESTNVWSLPIESNTGRVLGEIGRLTEGAGRDMGPSVSTDGRKLAFIRMAGTSWNFWIKDLQNERERLMVRELASVSPQIAPDGSGVVFSKTENQKSILYVAPTDGESERLCEGCGTPNGWSYDGKAILSEALATRAVVLIDIASGAKTEILKHPKFGLSRGRFSPIIAGFRSIRSRPPPGKFSSPLFMDRQPYRRANGSQSLTARPWIGTPHGPPMGICSTSSQSGTDLAAFGHSASTR